MRRDVESVISCKINPGSDRAEDEKSQLHKFSRTIQDFGELPSLIDDATAAMGLDEYKAFGKDVLSIEICGPNRPQLTLVDLPGLIHSANKSQSDDDVELIKSLVEDYIVGERTIILAVISAKNDYANQVILKNCRKFDPKGARTLGVITKPDFLRPGTENERAWLDLAQNRDIYFELGWHILKNRGDNQHQLALVERNVKERLFLSTRGYKALPQSMKGIDSLRERLSQLLFGHLKRELPALKEELDSIAKNVCAELQFLGRSRTTLADQRSYLADLLGSAYEIVAMGVAGDYENAFFGGVNIDMPIIGEANARFRAVVQHLNIEFTNCMHQRGHKYYIRGDSSTEPPTGQDEEPEQETSNQRKLRPLKLTREEAIERVVQILKRSRGREIPGAFNPMLIGHLFLDQSEQWDAITQDHINTVAVTCKSFLLQVLNHSAAPEAKERLLSLAVQPALKGACEAAFNELKRIMEDKRRHPITYNHYFTDTLQKSQQERSARSIRELAEKKTVSFAAIKGGVQKQYIDAESFNEGLSQATVEKDMDKFSAEQALDAHDAYYKAEKKYFIDVITKQVIERHLIAPLADVFSPKAWARYSDKEIGFLAAEQPETVQLREHLDGKKRILEEGQKVFRVALGQSV